MKIAFLLSEHVTTKLFHATGQLHTEILLSQLRIELFNGTVMVGLDLTKFSSSGILLGGNRTTRVERPEYFNRCTRTGDVFFVIDLQFIRKLLCQTVERIANHRTQCSESGRDLTDDAGDDIGLDAVKTESHVDVFTTFNLFGIQRNLRAV